MSKPQNPLNLFRSYAYHHILVACDGTDCAEELAKNSEITLYDHEGAEQRFCPQTAPSGKGRYVVLINGMSDSQFIVKAAKWGSVLIPNESTAEGSTHYRTMAVDGELTIQEPLGVNFLNLLNEVTKSLGTDANGVVFVLKTIFVGHRDDGQTEFISNIRPLMFLAYDIGAMFDVTGAEYTFAFVGIVNGAARLPHTSSVGDGFQYQVPVNATIGTALDGLAAKLETYYDNQWNKLKDEAECYNSEFVFDENYLRVRYKITYADEYAGMLTGTADLPSKSDTGDDDVHTTVSGNVVSVESLIDAIMNSSQEVLSENKDENDKRFMHKITSTLKTGPEEYTVEYQVQRFESVVTPVEEFFSFEPPDGPDGEPLGIEFDYIFTGKNIDIKQFDMKMNMGMAFFQTLSAESSVPGSANSIISHYNPESTVTGTGNSKGFGDQQESSACENRADTTRKMPLFLGMSVKDAAKRNKRIPGASVNYDALLARHAAFENIEARVVIHGNPQLLEETTQIPSAMDPNLPPQEAAGQVHRTSQTERLAEDEQPKYLCPNPHRIPGYVKVNVYMPNSGVVDDGTSLEAQDYARRFWYPGWYFMYGINHVFADGEFTQEIEMFSIPTDASQSKIGDSNTQECPKPAAGNGTGVSPAKENALKVQVSEAGKPAQAAAKSNESAGTN